MRNFYFALLVADPDRSPRGAAVVARYRESLPSLAHRPDGLRNVKGVAVMRWAQLGELLQQCASGAPRDDERRYAERALAFLQEKRLV